ncbi:unnamed protein product [Linum tenue]|uniref:Uncharacterized protein n=1 Tax=Linum tenue TaxID=586396 RepID=A0AAV0R595_9ROSI|nr:unnamed protein product [Linum tenue]
MEKRPSRKHSEKLFGTSCGSGWTADRS